MKRILTFQNFRFATYLLWVFCTLLLLLPDPRRLFFGVPVLERPEADYGHFLLFGTLTASLILSHRFQNIVSWFIFLMLYAVLTELLQIPIPYRTFEWKDLFQDLAGILIGFALVFSAREIRRRAGRR